MGRYNTVYGVIGVNLVRYNEGFQTEKQPCLGNLLRCPTRGLYASAAAEAQNPILDAIEALSKKLDKMALKTDLDELKSDFRQEIKVTIAETVDTLKSEIHDLGNRVHALEAAPAPLPLEEASSAVQEG